jgi:endo-1,4-beta-D-glucanase Y
MLLAVYMDDQALFDELWMYEQLFLDDRGLMNWEIDATGTQILGGGGAATDADEDMAFALVMADRQWGGKGQLSDTYLTNGKAQIEKIWSNEILEGKLVKPGDHWGDWTTVTVPLCSCLLPGPAQVTGNVG